MIVIYFIITIDDYFSISNSTQVRLPRWLLKYQYEVSRGTVFYLTGKWIGL